MYGMNERKHRSPHAPPLLRSLPWLKPRCPCNKAQAPLLTPWVSTQTALAPSLAPVPIHVASSPGNTLPSAPFYQASSYSASVQTSFPIDLTCSLGQIRTLLFLEAFARLHFTVCIIIYLWVCLFCYMNLRNNNYNQS